ncbi:MAG: sulfite exporter TauE/SafE family protein [Lachnospirales bacterium]
MDVIAIFAINAIVGMLIGWSGIAGFLLPIFYTGYMDYSVTLALTLSFSAFLVSGIIGSVGYYKSGNLEFKIAIPLGISSLFGAIIGIFLNSMIPVDTVKILLNLVVLASGISILIRERKSKSSKTHNRQINSRSIILVGVVTSILCALSGAGGPILVMPLLLLLGVNVKQAVGIALFDSIFIALPSVIGYGIQVDNIKSVLGIIFLACFAHGIGVFFGSKTSDHIKQQPLKISVAIFSIGVSLYMLYGLVL